MRSGLVRAGTIAMVLVGVALAGCGDEDSGTGHLATPLEVAWTGFENGDYASAAAQFREILVSDPGNAEASEGLGWCLARMDSLDQSIGQFASCLDLSPGSPVAEEAWAGHAASARDVDPPQYATAIESADHALSLAPRFGFRHDAEVTWEDLRLIIAQSSYALADYDRALAEIDSLNGNPPDPESPDFHEALLAELERLGNLIR